MAGVTTFTTNPSPPATGANPGAGATPAAPSGGNGFLMERSADNLAVILISMMVILGAGAIVIGQRAGRR